MEKERYVGQVKSKLETVVGKDGWREKQCRLGQVSVVFGLCLCYPKNPGQCQAQQSTYIKEDQEPQKPQKFFK